MYAINCMDNLQGLPHWIRQTDVFKDAITPYTKEREMLLREFPVRFKFAREMAVDTGGVCRDLFSAFWEKAYEKAFDGTNSLMPAIHPHIDMELFPLMGTIFSHGFISCGFMPVRLGFPTIASIVLGTSVMIPDSILLASFHDYLSFHDQETLKDIFDIAVFSDDLTRGLITMLAQFGCQRRPIPDNINTLILQIARHEFLTKPH